MVKLILFSPGEFILMPRKGTALQVPYYIMHPESALADTSF